MTFSITANRKCSRCPRVEQTEITAEDAVRLAQERDGKGRKGPPALSVSVAGSKVVEFDFLCATCVQIVNRYIAHAGKQPKHQSALRTGADIEIEE